MNKTAAINPSSTHVPGEAGVWIFILGDMTIFAIFFSTFMYYRAHDPVLFRESEALLSKNLGTLNTVLLLTSSWFVVAAVSAVRSAKARLASRLFGGAWLCAMGFIVVKIFEWGEKFKEGITLTKNDFFMYYFVFTGIHLFHLALGMAVLTYLIVSSSRTERSAAQMMLIEGGASYWHMVDLLWIILFPLLYLLP